MAEEQSATESPAGGKKGGTTFGLPKNLVLPAAVLLALVGYLMYTRSKNAQAAAQQSQNTGIDPTTGLPYGFSSNPNAPDASALYASLLNLQQQVGNLGPQAPTPTGTTNIHWVQTDDQDDQLSLNQLAHEANTTPQAIIQATAKAFGANSVGDMDPSLLEKQYFDSGKFDEPMPPYTQLFLPVPLYNGEQGYTPQLAQGQSTIFTDTGGAAAPTSSNGGP